MKECDAVECSFIYTALAPFAMELALVYLQLEEDEKNGFADTADYEHLKRLALDRGIIPNGATHAVGIGKFDVEIPVGSKFSINTYSFISGEQITGKQDGYFYYKMTSEQVRTEVNTVIGKLTAITFIRNLERKIISLLGNKSFSIEMTYNEYHLKIILFVQNFDKIEYLKEHIEGMIPCNIILDLIVIYNQYSMFTKYTYGELRTMTHKYMREHYFGEDGA